MNLSLLSIGKHQHYLLLLEVKQIHIPHFKPY